MKVAAFYYMEYPDSGPADKGYAATEMYVERAEDDAPPDYLIDTYSIQVYTYRYVQAEFTEKGKPLVGRSVLIIPYLDDDWMFRFLTANIERLPEWATKVGL